MRVFHESSSIRLFIAVGDYCICRVVHVLVGSRVSRLHVSAVGYVKFWFLRVERSRSFFISKLGRSEGGLGRKEHCLGVSGVGLAFLKIFAQRELASSYLG